MSLMAASSSRLRRDGLAWTYLAFLPIGLTLIMPLRNSMNVPLKLYRNQ